MPKTLTPEQVAEYVQDTERRLENRFARFLRVPMIRDSLREPAPGQEVRQIKEFKRTRKVLLSRCA